MERCGEWLPFSTEDYCRKSVLYEDLDWDRDDSNPLSFQGMIVSVAPFGGPIAMVRASATSAAQLSVYTSSGCSLRHFIVPTEMNVHVASVEWSSEETIMVLTSRGTLCLFELSSPSPGPSTTIKLLPSGTTAKCVVVMKSCGIILVDETLTLRGVVLEERKEPQQVEMDLSRYLSELPQCLEVMPSALTEEGETIVYVALGKKDKRRKGSAILVANVTSASVSDMKTYASSCGSSGGGGGISSLRLHPTKPLLAMCSGDGELHVVSTNFDEHYFSLKLGPQVPPQSFVWCGDKFLFCTYSANQFDEFSDYEMFSLLVPIRGGGGAQVSPVTKYEKLSWEDGCGVCIPCEEVDGVRIVTETACYFVECVPECLVNLYRLQSTSPTAVLSNAHSDYLISGHVDGLVKFRTLVQRYGDGVNDIVDELLEVASHEFDKHQQEKVLAVATFAKGFAAGFDSDKYVDVVTRLRVLNAVRDRRCGMPLSIRQYEYFSGSDHLMTLSPSEAQVLVDRLINRQQFQLALDIALILHMKVEKVLVQWSCAKVQSSDVPEAKLRNEITSVLAQYPGASFTDAALTAFRVGKQSLAIQLLNDEPRSQNKVLLFLQMHQDELALQKALESDDADLVVMVLIKMLKQSSPQQLHHTLSGLKTAHRQLFVASAASPSWNTAVVHLLHENREDYLWGYRLLNGALRGEDIHTIEDDEDILYGSGDNLIDIGENDDTDMCGDDEGNNKPAVKFLDVPMKRAIDGRMDPNDSDITKCYQLLESIQPSPSMYAEHDAKWLRQHNELFLLQRTLAELSEEDAFMNQSISKTIEMCFTHGMEKYAEQIRNKFHVDDKKFWYAKLFGLVSAEKWDEVDKLGGGRSSRSSRSPIGFMPFIEILSKHHRDEQACLYVSKLPDLYDRVEWYVKLDNFQRAIDDAFAEEEVELLHQIMRKASNPSTIEYIQKRISQLE